MGLTKDQKAAIDARDCNLIVSAAAGSGKTKVLIDRILKLIREGVNIDEMLIITFTRLASGEMRDRLSDQMYKWAKEERASEAYAQLERLEYAQICTIDSFCCDIVRTYFELADCDPNYRIIDEAQDLRIKADAIDEAIEAAYAQGIGSLGEGRTPAEVKQLARILLEFLEKRADPEEWYKKALAGAESDCSGLIQICLDSARDKVTEMCILLEKALSAAMQPNGPYQYAEAIQSELAWAKSLINAPISQLSTTASGFTPKLPVAKNVDEDIKKSCSDFRKKAKDKWDEIAASIAYDFEASLNDIHEDVPAFKRLYEIACDIDARVWEAKKEISGLTFSDVERRAVMVLRDDDAARGISERYKYIFVDEYQDTSDIQEMIVSRIMGKRNLFMVGDVKQSIYSFRGAVPSIFQEKCRLYDEGGDNRRLVLRENFRSSASVLDCINRIFRRVMTGGSSEILYDSDQQLNFGNSFSGKTVPCEILIAEKVKPAADQNNAAEESEQEEELDRVELEGRMIARRIHELMQSDGYNYSDFCILSRASTGFVQLTGVLAKYGIPAYTEKSDSFFDLFEIELVMSMLRLIVSGRNDLDILAVLRSPVIGMSTDDIAGLRADNPGIPLWQAMENSREALPGCGKLIDIINELRICAYGMSINLVIRRLFSMTGLYAFMGGLEGGVRRQGNLDLLCRKACSFEQDIGGSLADFVAYAANIKENSKDDSGAHEISAADNVVRIMTDHKSKGLQFKVVFAVSLDKSFEKKGNHVQDELMLDSNLGYSLKHIDTRLDTCRKPFTHTAHEILRRKRNRAEELRVLYVTLTRAEERLIMTGLVKDAKTAKDDWLLQVTYPETFKSSLDIACAAAAGCPGAEVLGGKPEAGAPEIKVRFFSTADLELTQVQPAPVESEPENTVLDTAELKQSFDWKYPYESFVYAPVKLSVTGLEREFTGGTELPDIHAAPEFMSDDKKQNPAGRGTAVHQALRNIDYDRLRSAADINASIIEQLAEMTAYGRLLPEESNLVTADELADFFTSETGKRVLKAEVVKREWSFCLRMPAERVIQDYPAGHSILVQGTIDLCFMEDGKWVLVDYKTNRTKDEAVLAAHYASQIDVYSEALGTLTGTEVKEAMLCLVTQRREISMTPKVWSKAI